MDAWVIFLSGMIIGMIIMAVVIAASNVHWGCRDTNVEADKENKNDKV